MDTDTRFNNSTSSAVLLGIGFLVGAIVVGSCWLSSRGDESVTQNKVVRNVIVDFMYETDPGSASGGRDLAVDSIEFMPGFVIMTDTSRRTRLLALDRLRKFEYRETKK